ncbi:PIN domain-containing protein [Halocatena pleomorpha]|uniref:Type II toxin-antitoxin system VapC family toxin n=1 Tax=Halocatena pleomorpha TaxID=1785090 RepID=A0A3P3RIP1_9EURY|nr:PIN domain-containing protein [Halocatena pleomorpha]RRJ32670.1 type II toxin-antitoxin system VapC family toxin [Halocatena pleomorpha]
MSVPDRVVFDIEPIVAHADDEPGSESVEEYLNAITAENATGYISRVNLTEIRYIIARKYDRNVADEYLDWLLDLGLTPVNIEALWDNAAEYVIEYNPSLGDSFALATAEAVDGTLLVGADDDYDDITTVAIERFREDPA